MSTMRLLITGGTGVAGLNIYRAALEDPSISSVTLLMRREMPQWAVLPANAPEKTTTIVHKDFTSYPSDLAARLSQHDACIWALGKSAVGVSEDEYTSFTYAAPMAFVSALRDAGVGEGREGNPFRFVYISAQGADPTEKSRQMWARVKGRTEKDLAALCSSITGMKLHIIGPGYFRPSREYPQDWPNQRNTALNIFDRIVTPIFNVFLPSLLSPLNELSSVALGFAKGRWPDADLIRSAKLRELAKQG